ncbi:Transglutaminase-like superfamily protein [Phycisphaerae bacterium RAS2]|nr:Transglutaminase-like superfamily protein [Phycisphaerae bacterium RAS2]
MQFRIEHETRFHYDAPIFESVMELRMQPRTDASQRCLAFDVTIEPEARAYRYSDALGNTVHHFNVPSRHESLMVRAVSLVEVADASPPSRGSADDWAALDALRDSPDHWDWLHPSHFARPGEALEKFAAEMKVARRGDPRSTLEALHDSISRAIRYERGSTRVDSPIEECLAQRKGVCQDFAHVFIALARQMGIPTRYVSGHLVQVTADGAVASEGATHAWAESFVPGAGWVGFDSSNRQPAGAGHIRVAIGRDYADVPPTRGMFRGDARTELSVRVTATRDAGNRTTPMQAQRSGAHA